MMRPTSSHPSGVFTATLVPENIVLPTDSNGDQIQAGGGLGLFPTPLTTTSTGADSDPAKGKIKLVVADAGKEIKVYGSLSDISNVSAITLRDLNYPAVFTLRGTPTAATGSLTPQLTTSPAIMQTLTLGQ